MLCALAACQSPPSGQNTLPAAQGSFDSANSTACERRVNDTLDKLEACVKRERLWERLAHFQRIADDHPGRHGHGNRDTGTAGYAASVAYVAALMRNAGYAVTIQRYTYEKTEFVNTPQLRVDGRPYAFERDWFVARRSAAGAVTAKVEAPNGVLSGCSPLGFSGFRPGSIALLQRGDCDFDTQVSNAKAAGAAAVILYDTTPSAYEARLIDAAPIPVVGVVSRALARDLLERSRRGESPIVSITVRSASRSDVDYNVIADSPFGDAKRVVAVDAHLDSIYGAGMLDNASGSTTILEIALDLAKTPTRNKLRFIWFGGEEIGLLGSRYYTKHLSRSELRRIVFDVDVDVTATPNFDFLIADPAHAHRVKQFPPNVVPDSEIGNDYFRDFFERTGVAARPANFGNNGTDSLSFSFVGVPNSGILTQQDCCKHNWEIALWGGERGNYEGKIGSFNGGCVDYPHRWCDNLSNNDPLVLELASRAVAYVVFKLANRPHYAW